MTDLEKMRNGMYYKCRSEELSAYNAKAKELLFQFNSLPPSGREEKEKIIRQIFASVGENPYIESPFQCSFGINIRIGDNVFVNSYCMFLDAGNITIGNDVLIGPYVGIYPPEHAIHPELRKARYEIAHPVVICDGVWIGANASILGGVTIGRNSIIGAGSVVTHDIPENVIAAGNPCRVLREITEEDRNLYGGV